MKERADFRIQTDRSTPDHPRRIQDFPRRPALSRTPSPLQGRRLLMSLPEAPHAETSLAEDCRFEDRVALAAHLAAEGMDVHLVVTGAPPRGEVPLIGLTPGVSLCAPDFIPSPDDDSDACSSALARLAARLRADLVFLHDPALAAARRDPRPTIVACDTSRAIRFHAVESPPSQDDAHRIDLERLGLHAADRVVTSSRAMSEALARMHGLRLPPAVVPPVFRPPLLGEARDDEAGVVLVGASRFDPRDLMAMDRAASLVCGTVLALDPGCCDETQALCLEMIHKLSPMSAIAAEGLAARAAAFYCPASGPDFDPLLWRAAGAGCALILPDLRIHREFWHGAAHFIPPGSDHALAGAIRRMFEDPDYRREQSACALRRAHALARGSTRETLGRILAGALASAPMIAAV